MPKKNEKMLMKYIYGLLAGILIAIAIINWSPSGKATNNLYAVTNITNSYTFIGAPLTWPAMWAQNSVNWGCSSDSEATGCYGTMDEINNGRIYLFIVLSLYCGLLALYWPGNKKTRMKLLTHALLFIMNLLIITVYFIQLFPEIIRHNSNSLINPIFLLIFLYIPIGLFAIYELVIKKLHKKPEIIKIFKFTTIIAFYILYILWFAILGVANKF
jgi:hypothetical protein